MTKTPIFDAVIFCGASVPSRIWLVSLVVMIHAEKEPVQRR